MSEMVKSPNRNQKKLSAFFVGVLWFFFFLKYFLYIWHCYAWTVFFTWIIILIRLYMSCLWKLFWIIYYIRKHLQTKHHICFGSDIFYRIQSFNWWPVFSITTHWTYTCLSPCALNVQIFLERFDQYLKKSKKMISHCILKCNFTIV